MKLVIDIPEEEYEEILSSEDCGLHTLTRAVANGTPLLKGHGRLIDEKDLSLMTVHMIDGMLVCDAPTIIEADGGDAVDRVTIKEYLDSFDKDTNVATKLRPIRNIKASTLRFG